MTEPEPHAHAYWTTGAGGYVPVHWVPYYISWWVYDGIPYQVKQRAGNRGITAENMEVTAYRFQPMKAPVWPVATYGCESWTQKKEWRNTSWRLWDERNEKNSVGFHGQQIKQVSGFLTSAGVKRELLDTVKARKQAYYGHTMRKQGRKR